MKMEYHFSTTDGSDVLNYPSEVHSSTEVLMDRRKL